MLSKMILTFVILSTFMVLVANEDNTLDLGDSKLYFSINSTINSKYYKKDYSGYTNILKSYHFKKNEEQGNQYEVLLIMYWKNRGKILTLSAKQSCFCLFGIIA